MLSRRSSLLAFVGLTLAPIGGLRARERRRPSPRPFFEDYRISRYLQVASEIQALSSDEARAKRLRALARDPSEAGGMFPLCRMLFEERPDGFFRRPELGAPMFVDGDSVGNWPLEPIALYRTVPILIVHGYALGGEPESPGDYLEYCLQSCRWRALRYAPVDAQTLGDVVERFVHAHPAITDPNWIGRQAR
jgi:hypothetical protein